MNFSRCSRKKKQAELAAAFRKADRAAHSKELVEDEAGVGKRRWPADTDLEHTLSREG